ncbi:MAG: FMN-binding negative transcriptional regulator [Hyphomonadaceae bacterium]|nr:FMN-binding negative transcriptional regulator [Hyphomonadaceae bacterium]
MYAHPKHVMADDEARAALAAFDRAALLVTPDLSATHLPLFLDGDWLVGHVARANPQWRAAPCEGLVVMAGPEAYVSPSWYPSKAEHGRAVPTWNYVTLHVRGRLETFDDPARLEDAVARLSGRHEAAQAKPWTIAEAPRDYIDRLMAGIVGVALRVDAVEGKRKLSQDRSAADQSAVAHGLRATGDPRDGAVAEAMAPPAA